MKGLCFYVVIVSVFFFCLVSDLFGKHSNIQNCMLTLITTPEFLCSASLIRICQKNSLLTPLIVKFLKVDSTKFLPQPKPTRLHKILGRYRYKPLSRLGFCLPRR